MDVVLSHVEQSNNKSVQNALFKIRILPLPHTLALSSLSTFFSLPSVPTPPLLASISHRLHLSIYPYSIFPSAGAIYPLIPSSLLPQLPFVPLRFSREGHQGGRNLVGFFFIFFSQILSCRRRTKEARRRARRKSCRGDGTHLFTLQTSELTFNHLQVRTIFTANSPRILHLAPISGLLGSGPQTALTVKPARLRPFSRKSRGLDTL